MKSDADRGSHVPSPASIVCLAPDLLVATRLETTIRACGGEPVLVDTPEELVAAVDRSFPVLALVDLSAPGDWANAIAVVKLRPQTAHTPIYAFGAHVDAATLQRARRAGADHAWARSRLLEELAAVVEQHLHPPVRYPAGWDAPLPDLARQGIEEFNRGDYFAQHEHLEAAWMAEPRPVREMYQGILQIGVALLQIERDNWPGAVKMFRRGLPRLRGLPPVCQGVDIAGLRSAAEAIHAAVTALGPDRLAEFDRRQFPQIRLARPHAGEPDPSS